MRLIDADALEEHKFLSPDHPNATRIYDETTKAYQRGWNDAIDAIADNAPTVEPFERIGSICEENCGYRPQGKCKDCKYFEKSLCENSPYGWCLIRRVTQEGELETQVPKDYCCSWFEKGGAE